jgi:hypothetical protein
VNFRILDEDELIHDDMVGFREVEFKNHISRKGTITVRILDKEHVERGRINIGIET